jgi:hypothetical protein
VGEPEVPQVSLAPLGWCAEPRVAEPLEAVPAHSCLVQPEVCESLVEPIISEITIEVGSTVLCAED